MHIVHVMDKFNPLLGQETNIIAKNHSPAIKVTIVTSTSLASWNITDYEIIRSEDLKYKEMYDVAIIRLVARFEHGEKIWLKNLIKTIRHLNPDLIYVHGIEYVSFFRIFFHSFFNSTTLVSDTHSLPIFTKRSLSRKIYYAILQFTIYRLVNYRHINVFYTAEDNKLLLQDIYGINASLVHPFKIGADFTNFCFTQVGRNTIRKTLAINQDEVMLLYSGRIVAEKGPHLILKAFSKIKENIKYKVRIVLIGFQDKKYVKDNFNDPIDYMIIDPVHSSELKNYFSAADIAVYPLEATLSALECQACRLPIIMEKNPTNYERVKDGGILYEKDNIDDLARALLELINDPKLRKQKGEKGYQYVSENYNYELNLRQMENKLLEIKARKSSL